MVIRDISTVNKVFDLEEDRKVSSYECPMISIS